MAIGSNGSPFTDISSMDQTQRERLAQQIRKAFARTPYPKGGFISKEWAQTCPYKPWQSVSFETLSHYWGDFYDHYLNFSELRYLLAPLLIGILLEPEHAGMLHAALIRELSPHKNYEKHFIQAVLNAMTHQESAAVSAFLNVYLDIISGEHMMCDEDELLNAIEIWDHIAQLRPEKFKGVMIKGGK